MRDQRTLDARHAAVLQLLAHELRDAADRRGARSEELDYCLKRLDGLAAAILVDGDRAASRPRLVATLGR